MNALRDVWRGWRATPLRSATLALLCLAGGALLAAGLLTARRAEAETRDLQAAWPEDHSTLRFTPPPTERTYRELTDRLDAWIPSGWMAHRIEHGVAWVDGALEGLQRDWVRGGHRVALLSERSDPDLRPGGRLNLDGRAYRVLGRDAIPLPVDAAAPFRSRPGNPPLPDTFLLRRPAREVTARLGDLPAGGDATLVDHARKRDEAARGFHRLRLRLLAAGGVTALLAALLILSLLQSDVRDRTTEFALRRALGAAPADIRNLVLFETLCTCVAPAALGLLPFLPALGPRPALAALATLSAWILLCALLPASHAAAISPATALKDR